MKYDGIDFIIEEKKIKNKKSQLQMGVEVEMEHKPTIQKIKAYYERTKKWPKDEEIAKWIAIDHLNEAKEFENKNYYDMLLKMEELMKKGNKW